MRTLIGGIGPGNANAPPKAYNVTGGRHRPSQRHIRAQRPVPRAPKWEKGESGCYATRCPVATSSGTWRTRTCSIATTVICISPGRLAHQLAGGAQEASSHRPPWRLWMAQARPAAADGAAFHRAGGRVSPSMMSPNVGSSRRPRRHRRRHGGRRIQYHRGGRPDGDAGGALPHLLARPAPPQMIVAPPTASAPKTNWAAADVTCIGDCLGARHSRPVPHRARRGDPRRPPYGDLVLVHFEVVERVVMWLSPVFDADRIRPFPEVAAGVRLAGIHTKDTFLENLNWCRPVTCAGASDWGVTGGKERTHLFKQQNKMRVTIRKEPHVVARAAAATAARRAPSRLRSAGSPATSSPTTRTVLRDVQGRFLTPSRVWCEPETHKSYYRASTDGPGCPSCDLRRHSLAISCGSVSFRRGLHKAPHACIKTSRRSVPTPPGG